MHILEMIVLILSIFLIILVISKKLFNKSYIVLFLAVTTLFFILHVAFDGMRWQLYALYSMFLLSLIVVCLRTFKQIVFKNILRRFIVVIVIFLFAVSAISVFVFPLYEMPTPSGEHLIGTESYIIEDADRQELYTPEALDVRRIKIQFWYPAESTEGYEQAPWLEDGVTVARALSQDMGLPFFVLDHTAKVMSNSYFEAPINESSSQYPVIILSHGWRGFRNLHTDFAEELASFGYIVVAIDHTYGSVATVFEDKDVAYLNGDALPDRETTPDFIDYANQLVNTYAADIITTLDFLEELNESGNASRFSGRMDLTRIGLLGHSTGGGADVTVALRDDRIDSVIGLDAWVEPIEEDEANQGLTIPSLFLRSGMWETGFNNTNLYALINNSSQPSILYQIDGTTHYDFAMVYMYSPLTGLIGITGEVESEYLTSILKSMITDFFDETLRDSDDSIIDIADWEEVRVIATQ